jgi:hypothetical protein
MNSEIYFFCVKKANDFVVVECDEVVICLAAEEKVLHQSR